MTYVKPLPEVKHIAHKTSAVHGPAGGAADGEGPKKLSETEIQPTDNAQVSKKETSTSAANGAANVRSEIKEEKEGPCGLPAKCSIL